MMLMLTINMHHHHGYYHKAFVLVGLLLEQTLNDLSEMWVKHYSLFLGCWSNSSCVFCAYRIWRARGQPLDNLNVVLGMHEHDRFYREALSWSDVFEHTSWRTIGHMSCLFLVLLFVQSFLWFSKNPLKLTPQCQHRAMARQCMSAKYHRTYDSVNSFGSSATSFEFVSVYVRFFCVFFCFTMLFESDDLHPLAGFDGRVELLPREAVWEKQFLHVLEENVMEASI